MKLVFVNEAEKREKGEIIMNASSISNSLSLIGLFKDSVVDGSEPEPKVEEKKSSEPEVVTLPMLIEKARSMGVVMDFENASRAGVLKAIEEFEASKPQPEPTVETTVDNPPMTPASEGAANAPEDESVDEEVL